MQIIRVLSMLVLAALCIFNQVELGAAHRTIARQADAIESADKAMNGATEALTNLNAADAELKDSCRRLAETAGLRWEQ